MTDTLLLPVYRIVLHSHIERGIHWSEIEHLLLWTLTRSAFGADELAARCNLPEAVAVEAIVRLMRVGWVELIELPDRVSFQASAVGCAEAEKDTLKPIARTISRNLHFVLDKVAGGVLSVEGLSLVRGRDLSTDREPSHRVLSVRVGDADFPGYVELIDKLGTQANLLYPDEKIVGVDPSRSTFDPDWFARITVSADRVEGLPAGGTADLRRLIVNEASRLTGEKAIRHAVNDVSHDVRVRAASAIRSVDLAFDDIIMGGRAHEECLRDVLSNARRRVVVHSTFMSKGRIEQQLEFLKCAAHKGVRIDLLWDRGEDAEGAQTLGECRRIIKAAGLASSVRVGDFPTKSHAKFLLADDGVGGYQVVIGSCNWFRSKFTSMEVSVRLRCPLLVSDFLQLFEKMIPAALRHSALREEVVGLALDLKQRPAGQGGTARVQLMSKGAHEDIVHEVRDNAETYILVGSNKAGNAAETQILAPFNEAARYRPVKVDVYFQSRKKESALSPEVLEELKKRYSRVEIKLIKQAHAKVLCWDRDNVVITSINWLSKDASPANPNQEIGVLIRSEGVADIVKRGYLRES